MSQISFIPYTHNKELFRSMYIRYANELNEFKKDKDLDPFFTYQTAYLHDKELDKLFIVCDGKIVGFIILQFVSERNGIVHPKWYIVEFCIFSEDRRQGIGREAVKHFCKTRSTHFFIYILKNNAAAQAFWKSVTKDLGLVEIGGAERDELAPEEETDVYCFHKRKAARA